MLKMIFDLICCKEILHCNKQLISKLSQACQCKYLKYKAVFVEQVCELGVVSLHLPLALQEPINPVNKTISLAHWY